MDETYIKVKGMRKYLYRAMGKAAARRFFQKATIQSGTPETVTVDKSGADVAALRAINTELEALIKLR